MGRADPWGGAQFRWRMLPKSHEDKAACRAHVGEVITLAKLLHPKMAKDPAWRDGVRRRSSHQFLRNLVRLRNRARRTMSLEDLRSDPAAHPWQDPWHDPSDVITAYDHAQLVLAGERDNPRTMGVLADLMSGRTRHQAAVRHGLSQRSMERLMASLRAKYRR